MTTTNDCRSTLAVISVARAVRGPAEPRLVQLMKEVPGDAIAALKVMVRVLEVQGALCETPDAAIEAAAAAGFSPYTEAVHPVTDQLAYVLVRYPMVGQPSAQVRVTGGHGSSVFPWASARQRATT